MRTGPPSLDEAFEFVARFFENSLGELADRNPGVRGVFRRIDADRFTAIVYRDGKAASSGSVVRGGMLRNAITWPATDRAEKNSCNDYLQVNEDEQGLHMTASGMPGSAGAGRKLTQEDSAEHLWGLLMRPLQGR